jgi:hypothetical protein
MEPHFRGTDEFGPGQVIHVLEPDGPPIINSEEVVNASDHVIISRACKIRLHFRRHQRECVVWIVTAGGQDVSNAPARLDLD